jgi:hypothetical protein
MFFGVDDITRAISQGIGAAPFHRKGRHGSWTLKADTRRLFVAAIMIMDFDEYAGLIVEALKLLKALEDGE